MGNNIDASKFSFKGMPFEIDPKLLITILGMILVLLVSLSTRASRDELAVVRERTSVLETKLNSICESQKKIEHSLEGISDYQKKILDRVSAVEGKTK